MKSEDFNFLSQFIYHRSGLSLSLEKIYLLESRLNSVLQKHGLSSLSCLVDRMKLKSDLALNEEVVEAMTTNETFFFRETKIFDYLRDTIFPKLCAQNSKSLIRVWCCAASTGQEPYSIGMLFNEMGPLNNGCKLEILASDISLPVLNQGKEGRYSQLEVQRGMPIQYLMKYFKQCDDGSFQINDQLRQMVDFQPFNLLDSTQNLGKFDVIFCRNVLIYFDKKTKTDVLQRLSTNLLPSSFLCLGSSEIIFDVSDCFKADKDCQGIYILS